MRLLVFSLIVAALLVAPTAAAQPAPIAPLSATDGPGAESHFDLARKDCIGTARNTSSKVWFTLANGVLSDVYFPTIDNTNVETMQFIVTDGATFTDLQTRDMTYSVASTDPRSLSCEVSSTAKSGKYRIVSQYITDPASDTLLVRVRFVPLVGGLNNYRLYVRLDPTINGNGGGGAGNRGADSGMVDLSSGHGVAVACDPSTTSNAVNRDYAQPVCSALDADVPFLQISNGFAGQPSDGLVQLDGPARKIGTAATDASNGNLVQTANVDLVHTGGAFTLALGYGQHAADAVHSAATGLSRNFRAIEADFNRGWREYDASLSPIQPAPPVGVPGHAAWGRMVDQYFLSINVVKASEDKTFPGALVASIASPWGQAISAGDPANTFFGSYREVFARDVYEAWTGVWLAGDIPTARNVVTWLFQRQQLADGSFPRNSLLNGKVAPDSFNTQLDECSYPILMAWQLGMFDATLYASHIKRAANFVISHGPTFGPERWEEQGGFSPSTIAAEVAGLIAAADIADKNNDAASAAVWRGVADDWQRQVEKWTVTTNGPLATHPYFIRLSKTGDPNAAISYGIGNGGPSLDQRAVVDAGFLELVRLGLVPTDDAAVVGSLPVVDANILSVTSTGPGWHRYNDDGYGDGAVDGHPWAPSGNGTGHLWPVLTVERGEYAILHHQRPVVSQYLQTLIDSSSGVGLIPEQVWELADLAASPFGTDPTVASIGFRNGHPAGSAAPLTWAAGAYVRFLNDFLSDQLLEQPQNTITRYVDHTQGQTTLTLTSPVDGSGIATGSVPVSGTTAPGNKVAVAATNIDQSFVTTTTTLVPDGSGAFSATITVQPGTTVLNVVATAPSGATALATRTVVFDFTPGTVVLDVADPSNDDNGPGTYQYPTSSDFHPGAFDIQEFLVIDDGTNVTFKLRLRDLSPTFGSPLGAQLADVYVHTPGVPTADTSTAAAHPARNYGIAAGGAWNRLVEVQGFGQRYEDAHANVLGRINITGNAVSHFITFSVPAASLGHPGPGWAFTVVLTGQDGFAGPSQARGFAPTPQPFQFGVCAPGGTSPICSVDPATVPKAMDVLTPPGVSQAGELDPTRGPVLIQPVTVP